MRVLVIHTWGMGDLIMATPMMRSLYLSGYIVDVALMNTSSYVMENAPFINKIYKISSIFELFKFSHKNFIFTFGTNPKKAKIFRFFLKRIYANNYAPNIHRIDANLKTVNPLLTNIDRTPFLNVENLDVSEYIKDCTNIGFAVGSGAKQKFKRWEKEKFKKLIDKFEGNKLVFIGPDEKDLGEYFEKEGCRVVKEPLDKVISIIDKLDFLVGNDNGLMHIGYALKKKTFTIFGMTNEKEIGGYYPFNYSIFLPMECRPCFDSRTDFLGCNSYDCLKNLDVDYVYNFIKAKL